MLSRIPNARGVTRRSAAISQEYGSAEDSTATAMPTPRTPGRRSRAPASAAPTGATAAAATTIAHARPDAPGNRRPVDLFARM